MQKSIWQHPTIKEAVFEWESINGERVKIGSDRKQSGTARENLRDVKIAIPEVLSDAQKELCDYAAPGLRKLLGYE